MNKKNAWEKLVDVIVDSLGYAIVRFAPVIAPIPSIAVILEVSGYTTFAWFTVVTIEMVGYAIGDKMVESVRRKVLGMNRAILPIVVYALVIEGLMLGYRVIPAWTGDVSLADAVRASVSMLYPFFTLAGAGLYAFHEYLKEVANDTNYDKETLRNDKREDDRAERELKRQRQEAELFAYRAKLAQDAEMERERALSDLRIKEQKAAVKSSIQPVQVGKSSGNADGKLPFTERQLMERMITIYQSNPSLSNRKVADELGTSHTTVGKLLSTLVSKDVVHVGGAGRDRKVTVNGKLSAFLAGEM